ncbi:MAG: DUF255 domain-containing protein [Sulfurovum sp.]|nr:DUF255 domain-containing protein [Sulfurovum sp.]
MRLLVLLFVLSLFASASSKYTNALEHESSPYLQQHKHNPVNWYPWGDEALNKAQKENKLIFLSIGYSTCHWCHVMEEESFTDLEVAKLLNENFVSIKVDRESFSQIDKKYQKRFMDLHGERGGWPLSVFLSPNKEVIHLGTYIPKEEGYGSEGLLKLLPSFMALQKDPQAFKKVIEKHKVVQKESSLKSKVSTKLVKEVLLGIEKQYDKHNGGFAVRPKFPEASKLDLLLDIYRLNGDKKAFVMAEKTFRKMAQGGIYDQIGGGFFRYTTDPKWQMPHFEKMLYTNAELISVYVKLYKLTGDVLYKKVVDESIEQMQKHFMQDGVYYSATDADSNGEEGGYFIYEYASLKETLKEKRWSSKALEESLAYLGIEEDGNVDGDLSHVHITSEVIPEKLEALKTHLKSLRKKRTFPFIDKKINTAWNAMMVKALFDASKLDDKYLSLAEEQLGSLLRLMVVKKVLYHQTLLGQAPKQEGLLEDYAFLIAALIAGYERNYNEMYLELAESLSLKALTKFYRKKDWYLSDDGIEALADFDDRYYTSALSVMLENLLILSSLRETDKYSNIVKESIKQSGRVLEENPASAAKLVHLFLRLTKGEVIIHAKKEKLLSAQDALDKVKYPFLLSVTQESDEYLACKTTMCFAHDKNISKLIEKINEAVK